MPDSGNNTDTIAPELINYSLSPKRKVKSGKTITITAEVSDNVAVRNVWLRISGARKNFRQVANNNYQIRFRIFKRGIAPLRLIARDTSNNRLTQSLGKVSIR